MNIWFHRREMLRSNVLCCIRTQDIQTYPGERVNLISCPHNINVKVYEQNAKYSTLKPDVIKKEKIML